MASSAMGLNLWVFGFLQPKNDHRALCGFERVIVFPLRPQYMHVTYAPDEPRLFWLWEKPDDPHAGIKMAQGLVSLVYICAHPLTLQKP